ncbi:MAG: heat-inducible transcriptional repressor HrcA [Ilumatobacteraceae bacterium]
MLDDRKTAILRAVVQEYITTAQPVGSTHVSGAPGVQVSSATVRNDMAALEQEGFLVQPHTSAGRIPTDKGYRFFVDHLTPTGRLDADATQQVGEFFGRAHGRLEELLSRTSDLLAHLTHYAAVVVGPNTQSASLVRSVQIVGLSARLATVVVVLSNGHVDNQSIELADETSDSHLYAATVTLQNVMVGKPLGSLIHVPASGDADVDRVCAQALDALHSDDGDSPVFVGGASSVAKSFDAVDVVRSVLSTLEQQYVVVSLVRDVIDRGLTVAIGAEHGLEPLFSCSVVVKSVTVDGEQLGTVGVLGPTRMNYPQALATVDVVSDRLGRRLAEG